MEEQKMEKEMKRRSPIRFLGVFALIIGGLTITLIASNTYAEPQFLEEMVPMRDGVRLHTFVYLPDSKVLTSPYPAIVQRTPYGIGKPGVLPGPVGTECDSLT